MSKGPWGLRVRPVPAPGVQPTGTPPATVSGGYGVVQSAASQVDTTKTTPSPRPMTPKEAQTLMTAELLQAIKGVAESTTELSAKIGRQGATNGVLDVALVTLDASGVYAVDYPVTVGSLVVVNHGAANLVVHSGPPSSSAPSVGRGVQVCEPHARLVMPVGQREFAVWGTAAGQFSLQVFTGLQPFGTSL